MSDRFADKVALVTGASRGIGLAVAHRLLSEGARVCITGRKLEALEDAANSLATPDRVLTCQGQADDEEHQVVALELCAEKFGGVDVLVNNVGVNPEFGDLLAMEARSRARILDTNVLGTVNWTRNFLQTADAGTERAIVTVSSVAGIRPARGIGFYGVSKAALIQLTQQLAFELAPQVRVNAVAPAVIATRFSAALYEGKEDEVVREYPLGRLGTAEDVASAVAFLASSDASWITGQTLIVDGGITLSGGV